MKREVCPACRQVRRLECLMAYKMYPRRDNEYLLQDFEVDNPSLVVFMVADSGAGEDLCFQLDQPGVYEFIRDASIVDALKSDLQALDRILPVLEQHLGASIRHIRAVGVLNGKDDLWMHLSH